MTTLSLEAHLRAARERGEKLLVPYVTGGLGGDWLDVIRSVVAAGANAVEVGIPFSDPVMDGPTIQEASVQALAAGATPHGIVGALHDADVAVPLAVMTYLNIFARTGYKRMAEWLKEAGISAAILPDMPLEESGPWLAEAKAAGIETVMLAGPTTPDSRLPLICEASSGFVYAVGLLGVTGERESLASSALVMARRCKAVTDKPVLVGVGVSTPEQAAEVCEVADGVVIGSALIRRLLEGAGPEGAGELIAAFRKAIS
jgi:tryptophan synthase alpha chain